MIINEQKALNFLLIESYTKKFEVIDGFNQHPQGLSYEEWLAEWELLDKEASSIDFDTLRASLANNFNKIVRAVNDSKQNPTKDELRKLLSAMSFDMAQLIAFENQKFQPLCKELPLEEVQTK
jgi:hypothetical protein